MESEFDLWCEIVLSSPKAEVLKSLFQQVVDNGEKKRPAAHPINLLRSGNASVVRKILKYLVDNDAWPDVYQVCQEVVAAATSLNNEDAKLIADQSLDTEAVRNIHAARGPGDLAILAVGTEWSTWSLLLRASKFQANREEYVQVLLSLNRSCCS